MKMNKELEIVNELIEVADNYEKQTDRKNPFVSINKETLVELQQALQRLEAIDSANPSEALRVVDKIIEHLKIGWTEGNFLDLDISFDTIKQALIKSQEQEKVLEIIKERQVNIALLMTTDNVEEYNFYIPYEEFEKYLTQEEFELLKQYFEKNIQK